jgi:hypothetical protein
VSAEQHVIGTARVLRSHAPEGPFEMWFEDDGRTGFLYAGRASRDRFLDALQVWRIDHPSAAGDVVTLEFVWTADGTHGGLELDGQLVAAFDFAASRGTCLLEFPPRATGEFQGSHAWTAEALEWFAE